VDDPYANGAKSLDNEVFWSANGQPFPTVLVSYFGELEYYFNSFYDLNVLVDVIPSSYDFSRYKIVVAPLIHMIKPGFKEAVEAFVKAGGTFITTYFSGLIDEHVGVYLGGYLGPLKEVLGVKVEEYDPLPPNGKITMKMTQVSAGYQAEYECSVWAEVVHATTAKALAVFADDYYAGCPSFTVNDFGKGKAYYVATRPGHDFMRDFLKQILNEQDIDLAQLPQGVERVTRTKGGTSYNFYLNHNPHDTEINLPHGVFVDLLTGHEHKKTLNLSKYGVSILKDVRDI
jgi:beta-galactosidase